MNNNKINLPCYDTLVMTHKFNDYEESVQYIDLIEKVLDNPQKNTNKIITAGDSGKGLQVLFD